MTARAYVQIVAEGENYISLYDQSRDRLAELPILSDRPFPPNLPNIFSLRDQGVDPKRPLRVVSVKADIGGVGGHVEPDAQVKAYVGRYMLLHNRRADNRAPIFISLVVSHTGDDICVTLTQEEAVPESTTQELIDHAYRFAGTPQAAELGNYGPGQDLLTDAFTGNLHGTGIGACSLLLPVREDPRKASQSVMVAAGDKCDPAAVANWLSRAYWDANFNTGLLIANSAMFHGYRFMVADLDTKARAREAGCTTKEEIDAFMHEALTKERVIPVDNPIELQRLLLDQNRFVVSRVWSKKAVVRKNAKGEDEEVWVPDQLGFSVVAERLHNVSGTYSGKDDPVALALCQGDWPAPGEITSVFIRPRIVAGDCRGSHRMAIRPQPINSPTSLWSGPIITCILMSINLHNGRIGSLTDHFAHGTAWDTVRTKVDELNFMIRDHGATEPATLPVGELEYQDGYKRGMAAMLSRWEEIPAGTLNTYHG